MSMRLPEFAVSAITGCDVTGRFEPSNWVEIGQGVALRISDQIARGKFLQVDVATRTAVVRLWHEADAMLLQVGKSYPFLDLYWGDRAFLVLDRTREWRRTEFTPVDAVQYFSNGQRVLTKAAPGQSGGDVVPSAWDHEHCEICHLKISLSGPSVGWTFSTDEWLCERCYEAYVVKRSLEFVSVE